MQKNSADSVERKKWLSGIYAAATKEQCSLAAELDKRGFSQMEILVLVFDWEASVIEKFWELRCKGAKKLGMREAIIYAIKILFRHPCDGSERVDLAKEDVGELRDFLLGGVGRGHIEKPAGEEGHATLSAIREALRKDSRLTGTLQKYKPNRPGARSDEQLKTLYQLRDKCRFDKEKQKLIKDEIAKRLRQVEEKKRRG